MVFLSQHVPAPTPFCQVPMLLLLWCHSLRYRAIEKEGQQAGEWINGVTKYPTTT